MPLLKVNLDPEDQWPDLGRHPNRVMRVSDARCELTAVPGGMVSGRASVLLRIDLPTEKTVVVESSLRAWHAATMMLVTKYGEPWMQNPYTDREERLAEAMRALLLQNLAYQQRLGEKPGFDTTAADERYDARTLLAEMHRLAEAILDGQHRTEGG